MSGYVFKLPFGEEISAEVGGRSQSQGYVDSSVRQGFTSYERDDETGLDYAQARYFSSGQGRFTSVDPILSSGRPNEPQTWNRYAYALNNPLLYTDPSGQDIVNANLTEEQQQAIIDDWKRKTGYRDIQFVNGKLVINTEAGYEEKGTSQKFRDKLLAAATSQTDVFSLRCVDGTKEADEVAFTEVGLGRIRATRDSTVTTYDVRIDFGDYEQLHGHDEVLESFSLGINLIHEFTHKLDLSPTGRDTPNSDNDPGPLERTHINPARQELGLPERTSYSFQQIGGKDSKLEALFFKRKDGTFAWIVVDRTTIKKEK